MKDGQNKFHYESPLITRMQVELEEGLCVVASGVPAKIDKQDVTVEVEDFKEINGDISFD